MAPYQKLFTPWQIGKTGLKNRIVMPPMATNFADPEGKVNERHIAYYRRRARGGAGLIIFEHTGVAKQGKAFPNMALIDSDDKVPPFRLHRLPVGWNPKALVSSEKGRGPRPPAPPCGESVFSPSLCLSRPMLPARIARTPSPQQVLLFTTRDGRITWLFPFSLTFFLFGVSLRSDDRAKSVCRP